MQEAEILQPVPVLAIVVQPETSPIEGDQQSTPTAVVPITVVVDSAPEPTSATDAPPTSAVDAEAAPPTDSGGISVKVKSPLQLSQSRSTSSSPAFDTHDNHAKDSVHKNQSNVPDARAFVVSSTLNRSSLSSAVHAKPVYWSTRDLRTSHANVCFSCLLTKDLLQNVSFLCYRRALCFHKRSLIKHH